VKAFHKPKKKSGKEVWTPPNPLSENSVPKLEDVVKEVHENIKKLSDAFDPESKSKR